MAINGQDPFETNHARYDAWFERHAGAYHSELLAIRAVLPWHGLGIEIGVGTGRFAEPLGVQVGLEPCRAMLTYTLRRGILAVQGVAEFLPFKGRVFDYALVVTTICFVQDARAMLAEARRVLRPGAPLVIGFVDRESELGRQYLMHQAENVFYRNARFYAAEEVKCLLGESGFSRQVWVQTLMNPLSEEQRMEPLRGDHGQGGFVVVLAAEV